MAWEECEGQKAQIRGEAELHRPALRDDSAAPSCWADCGSGLDHKTDANVILVKISRRVNIKTCCHGSTSLFRLLKASSLPPLALLSFLPMKTIQHCHWLPREVGQWPPLDVFRFQMAKARVNLVWPHSWSCLEQEVGLETS